jgi:hypothetical protein
VNEDLREAVAELEDYLDGVPRERSGELVLPFASRWILGDVGLDLARLREEADTLVKATPLSDRIVSGYVDHVAYWVSRRMLLDGESGAQLERARAALSERAALLEAEGFPRVAGGVREAAAASDVWTALAERIAESVL